MKDKNKKNHINVVDLPNGILKRVNGVKNAVKCHFEKFFKESCFRRPVADGIDFKFLFKEESNFLKEPFFESDITEVVWNCDRNKSAKPDRYNFYFLKKCWETVKEYVFSFVKDFHSKEKLTKAPTDLGDHKFF